jgi:protease I
MNRSLHRTAILVENLYHEMEVWVPFFRLQELGAKVALVGPKKETYRSKLGYPAEAELDASEAARDKFDALIIPGGYAPDLLRTNERLVHMVRAHVQQGAIVAAICHGTWMLASADVLKGRKATGATQIRDDIRNAGATWVDQACVRDGNIITSRKPGDLPQFCAAIIEALAETAAVPAYVPS